MLVIYLLLVCIHYCIQLSIGICSEYAYFITIVMQGLCISCICTSWFTLLLCMSHVCIDTIIPYGLHHCVEMMRRILSNSSFMHERVYV